MGSGAFQAFLACSQVGDAEFTRLWAFVTGADVWLADMALPDAAYRVWSDRSYLCQARMAKRPCQGVLGVAYKLRLMRRLREQDFAPDWESTLLTTALEAIDQIIAQEKTP